MFLSQMRRSFTVAQNLKLLNECENNSYKEVSIKNSIHLSMLSCGTRLQRSRKHAKTTI
jgi:hypothetical protein